MGYYNAKFSGIAALFPAATEVVPLAGRDLGQRLQEAIDRAWEARATSRQATRELARTQAEAAVRLYERFAKIVDQDARGHHARAIDGEVA